MLPLLRTELPGPLSRSWVDRLALRECPAITARRSRRAATLGVADTDPGVWASAQGRTVWDVDGNRFVDLCAGFGVASVGHRHPKVVAAGQAQLGVLPHAMGDAFPDPRRIELMERLCALTGLDRVIFGSSGSDAVEAAIKTALLTTGRRKILSFSGGYHGLASAPLAAIGYKQADFEGPFRAMLGQHVDRAPYGGEWPSLADYAAVLVEPVQGRGGMRAPPPGWLVRLHQDARAHDCLVIHDEVYSGFGRTGWMFAADEYKLKPDLLCVGKAMAGGFPISACVGTAAVMDAWGASKGEAIHTQTFLGNPVGCAMALAALAVVEEERLPERAREDSEFLSQQLKKLPGVERVEGRGLMLGAVVGPSAALRAMRGMLEQGYLILPCGERGEALGFSPPLGIGRELLEAAVVAMGRCLAAG